MADAEYRPSFDELVSYIGENKDQVGHYAQALHTVIKGACRFSGKFEDLSTWLRNNAEGISLSKKNASGILDVCRYIVGYTMLKPDWEPDQYRSLEIPKLILHTFMKKPVPSRDSETPTIENHHGIPLAIEPGPSEEGKATAQATSQQAILDILGSIQGQLHAQAEDIKSLQRNQKETKTKPPKSSRIPPSTHYKSNGTASQEDINQAILEALQALKPKTKDERAAEAREKVQPRSNAERVIELHEYAQNKHHQKAAVHSAQILEELYDKELDIGKDGAFHSIAVHASKSMESSLYTGAFPQQDAPLIKEKRSLLKDVLGKEISQQELQGAYQSYPQGGRQDNPYGRGQGQWRGRGRQGQWRGRGRWNNGGGGGRFYQGFQQQWQPNHNQHQGQWQGKKQEFNQDGSPKF